ncbi:MAG: hypothetical protein IT353_02870 [Gemmatimonadaceae bacterium]|nr:hypothetical protein [Gemmatimonadaceae bacterium]
MRPESARARTYAAFVVALYRRFIRSDRSYGARRRWRDALADGFAFGLQQFERVKRA